MSLPMYIVLFSMTLTDKTTIFCCFAFILLSSVHHDIVMQSISFLCHVSRQSHKLVQQNCENASSPLCVR